MCSYLCACDISTIPQPIKEDWINVKYNRALRQKYDRCIQKPIDLEGIDLENIDLENLNLEDLNLEDLDLENIDLENIDLDNIDLEDIDLENIDLENLDLEDIDCEKVDCEKLRENQANTNSRRLQTDFRAAEFDPNCENEKAIIMYTGNPEEKILIEAYNIPLYDNFE